VRIWTWPWLRVPGSRYSGPAVDAQVTHGTDKAARDAALSMAGQIPGGSPITLGSDNRHQKSDFVAGLRALGTTPHVAQTTSRRSSAIDARAAQARRAGLWMDQDGKWDAQNPL
jgi:hypothetical protein